MFIGGNTPAPTSPNVSPAAESSRRSISRRTLSKSAKELSNVGREGQTRLTSMVDLLHGEVPEWAPVLVSCDEKLSTSTVVSRAPDRGNARRRSLSLHYDDLHRDRKALVLSL